MNLFGGFAVVRKIHGFSVQSLGFNGSILGVCDNKAPLNKQFLPGAAFKFWWIHS